MNAFGFTFDHFGLATRRAERAVRFLKDLGYDVGEKTYDPGQRVNLILCASAAMPAVEVIFPADEPGPLDSILADRAEAVYHLCYRSSDLPNSLTAMKQAGHRVMRVAAPKPAILFANKRVSFYLVKGFGLIEILED